MFSFRCSVTTVCLTRKAFENNYCEKKHSWGILSPNILRIIEQFRSGRTSEGHLIQTVPQRRNNRKVSSSCSGPCSRAFWKPPRLVDKQFLCSLTAFCFSLCVCFQTEFPLLPLTTIATYPSVIQLWQRPGSIFSVTFWYFFFRKESPLLQLLHFQVK